MARPPGLSVPTEAGFPDSLVFPVDQPWIIKLIGRLPKFSLLALVEIWLDLLEKGSTKVLRPYLIEDEELEEDVGMESEFETAATLEEVREYYYGLKWSKTPRREAKERILGCEWRHGLTLYQLATAETQYLLDFPNQLRWSAFKLLRIEDAEKHNTYEGTFDFTQEGVPKLPRFHAATFLQNLQQEISPVVKAHLYLTRASKLPLTILRIWFMESPYATPLATSRNSTKASGVPAVIFAAIPDGAPYVFISTTKSPRQQQKGSSTSSDVGSLRQMIIDAIPRAFSRPMERYTFRPTSLVARSLGPLLALRGGGRGNAAAGGWSIFADGTVDESPLAYVLLKAEQFWKPPQTEEERVKLESMKRNRGWERTYNWPTAFNYENKKFKTIAEGRFGNSARAEDGKGIDRVDIRMEDSFPKYEKYNRGWRYPIQGFGIYGPEEDIHTQSPTRDLFEDDPDWCPDVGLTFQGTHVFAGIKSLVESGVIHGEKMPGWMTGEDGVSVGVVRDGRIRLKKE